jgi:hypothetical protein
MPAQLPSPKSLADAVREVIRQNKELGYQPNRFIGATQEGYSPNLRQVCIDLMYGGDALQALEDALERYPTLLTLEDLVGGRNLVVNGNSIRMFSNKQNLGCNTLMRGLETGDGLNDLQLDSTRNG